MAGHSVNRKGFPVREPVADAANLVALYRSSFYLVVLAILLSTLILTADQLASASLTLPVPSATQQALSDMAAEGTAAVSDACHKAASVIVVNLRWILVVLVALYAYAAIRIMERRREGPFAELACPRPTGADKARRVAALGALNDLEDELLARVAARMPARELAAAIAGADEAIVDSLLRNMSRSRGEHLLKELELAASLSPDEVQTARQRALEAANRILGL